MVAVETRKLLDGFTELGGEQIPMTPTEFGRFFFEDTEKWARVIRAANIKPD